MAQHPTRVEGEAGHLDDHNLVIKPVHNSIEAAVLAATAGQSLRRPAAGGNFEAFTPPDLAAHEGAADPHSTASYGIMVGGGRRVSVQATAPTGAQTGDVWIDTSAPLFVRKTADTGRVSTTTVTDDPHLLLAVEANSVYMAEGFLIYDGDTAGDLRYSWAGPTGATFDWVSVQLGAGIAAGSTSAAANYGYKTIADNAGAGASGVGTKIVNRPSGLLVVGATAGNFSLQWAQNTSSTIATTLYTNSHLRLIKVA